MFCHPGRWAGGPGDQRGRVDGIRLGGTVSRSERRMMPVMGGGFKPPTQRVRVGTARESERAHGIGDETPMRCYIMDEGLIVRVSHIGIDEGGHPDDLRWVPTSDTQFDRLLFTYEGRSYLKRLSPQVARKGQLVHIA